MATSVQTIPKNGNQTFSYFGLEGVVLVKMPLKFHFLMPSCDSDGSGGHSHSNSSGWQEPTPSASQKTWDSVPVIYKAGPQFQFLAYVPPSAHEDRRFQRAAYPIIKGGWTLLRIRRINCPLKPAGAHTGSITSMFHLETTGEPCKNIKPDVHICLMAFW